MAKNPTPKLALIGSHPVRPLTPPPAHLDEIGAHLWREVTTIYEFDDPGSYEVLSQACSARSRAARCAEAIARDGELLRAGKILRAHPLLRDELANRAFCVRCLQKLGLDLEPVRDGPGRPPGCA